MHNKRLSIIDSAIGDQPNKLFLLREALHEVAGEYDYCVIDTPPARNTLSYNALTAADGVVIPAEAAEYSLGGIADLAESIEMTRKYTNPELAIIGVLMTQHRAVAIAESQAEYTDIFDYAPSSGVASDYMSLVEEVITISQEG